MERIPAKHQMQCYQSGNEMLAVLAGSLRMDNSEALKTELLERIEPPVEKMYVNLTGLREVDSAGLGVLVGLHMTARKKKVALTLLSPTADQMRLFECTRLTTILSIVGGLEAETIRQRLEVESNALHPTQDA
jgi:anti-anti-sigma factor